MVQYGSMVEIPEFRMLKQEDRYKFKTSLGFDVIPRPTWAAL